MRRSVQAVMALATMLTVWAAVPASADVAPLDVWTAARTVDPPDTFTESPGNITVSAGSSRLLVVAAVIEQDTGTTVSNFNATLGATALTAIASSATNQREVTKLWYLPEASIPGAAAALTVSGTCTGNNVTGLHIYWASFSGVDQSSPISGSSANYAASTTVTFGAVVNYAVGGLTLYASGNGGNSTETPPATFTQIRNYNGSNGHSSAVANSAVHASTGSYPAATSIAWSGGTARSAAAVASLRPVATTVGNGLTAEPTTATVCPESGSTDLDNFTFRTSSGTDTINSVTVTLGPANAFDNVATVSVTDDAGTTTYGSAAPVSNTVAVGLTTNITATTTETQYRVRITPKTHAAMPAVPGASYATTGTVTAVGHTAANVLVYNDTASGTITVDNGSTADPVWGTITPASGQIALNWTVPADADFADVLILRRASAAVADAPAEGSTYTAPGTLGASDVVYVASGTSFTDTGLTDGTSYYYKIFGRDACVNHSAGAATGPHEYPLADLGLTKSASAASIYANESVTYTLGVTNAGPSNAAGVTVSDPLPAGLTYVSATPSQGSCSYSAPTVTCSLGTVNNGAAASVAIVATGAVVGSHTNTASVAMSGTDPTPANDSASVATTVLQIRTADLGVSKSGLPASVAPAASVVYTVVVTNGGPDTANAVTLSDPIPAGMSWVSTATTQGSCSGSAIVSCSIGTLANGSSATVNITVTNDTYGTKANTATVASSSASQYDDDPSNNSATATTLSPGGTPLCGAPGKDGAAGTLAGVVNTYYPGTASVSAGVANTCIPVGASTGAGTAIATDDLLLVIQMQDATINSANTDSYGDGTVGGGAGAVVVNAGKYEFAVARDAVGGGGCAVGEVPISGSGANGGLLNGYSNADASTTKGQERFQVVRVPQHTTATLDNVTAAPWVTNTAAPIGLGTGGILAIDVQGELTLANSGVPAANVDGLGFRGGAGRQLAGDGTGTSTNLDWRLSSTINTHGSKGEGMAGTPTWVNSAAGPLATNQPNDGYPNGSMARGAPGNAGGGSTDDHPVGNDYNSGGGGGSNGGAGGRGGFSWNTGLDRGGVGAAVTPAITQLVLGGGGGAGTRNNSPGDTLASGGTSGGGLMVLRAGSLSVASGAILSADGAAAYNGTLNDGGGGGGAGGSVIVTVTAGDMSGLTIRARGGRGGDAWNISAPGASPNGNRHGPGGGGGGGVAVYTNTAAPPTLDVSGGLAGITTTALDNFGALPGGIGQMLFAAPGMIPGLGSGSDCSTDLTINLTHTETTVSPGGTATFLATVTNEAPFTPTSGAVTVSITFNADLQPTAASGSGWSCSISAPPAPWTVTCTTSDVLQPQESYPPISITTTVLASGPATLSNNTATVSGGGDSNPANNTDTDEVGVRSPTLAQVREFEAVRIDGAVHLHWRTTYEVDNLGFLIHRDVGGVRELVTPAVIAGCALATGKNTPHASGRRYSWVDETPGGDGAVYWLEDIDLDGTRTWTGPVAPTAGQATDDSAGSAFATASTLLSRLGQGAAQGVERRSAGGTSGGSAAATASASAAVKLLVRQEGWYRVTRDELRAAGFDPGSIPTGLRLTTAGVEQAILINDGGDGSLDGSDTIEFYGTAIDSQYDDARVYQLVTQKGKWQRVKASRARRASAPTPANFPFTVERKDRKVSFFALTNNGDDENLFGDVVTSATTTNVLVINHLDPATTADATLTVALQGVTTETQHEVDVLVNGLTAGSLSFPDQESAVASFSIPSSWLREGDNEVSLAATGQGFDVSVIDYIRVTYPHQYLLDDGYLRMTVPGGTRLVLGGLPDASLRVIEVTTPGSPVELDLAVSAGGDDDISAVVGIPDGGTRTLIAFTSSRQLPVDGVILESPSSWGEAGNSADLVVIAHPSLLDAVQPLLAQREAQGLATALVDVTDVYDEFSYGQRTPYAIRDFLQLATQDWLKAPRWVLLVGDASFDPKNYLGLGDYDLVPTKFVATTYLKTSSDDWFADFDSDGLPSLALGRLPARTPDEASLMVSKILARESALGQGWATGVLLVSDENYEFDFEAASAALSPLLPGDLTVREVAVDRLGAGAPAEIVSQINAGQLLVNYTGHGSVDVWSRQGIFDGVEAAGLANGDRLPVFVMMTCLSGFFADLYTESLSEALLLAPNGGAVSVWASSGMTEPDTQALMNQELFRQLFKEPAPTLGEAAVQAKAAVSDEDVRRTWVLFGDPSMSLR